MRRVLILCTGNSCRSQMAEVLWRRAGRGEWECHSAGSRPAGYVHPQALAVLEEWGFSQDVLRSKSVEEFAGQQFDLVITVCDNAREACPVFPGAENTLHWPFPDPADALGSDEEVRGVFRAVREAIDDRIRGFLSYPFVELQPFELVNAVQQFKSWMSQAFDQAPMVLGDRRARYDSLVDALAQHFGADSVWDRVPLTVEAHMKDQGWRWNGIYVIRGPQLLRLHAAAGPPVCAELSWQGPVGQSGMCFDSLSMNQSVIARDVSEWPGYVSCDDESGITTKSSMACPIRDRFGRPCAVWDLDSDAELSAADAWVMERILSTLSAIVDPTSWCKERS